MPTLFVVVQTFGRPPVLYDLTIEGAIVADLDGASLGKRTGSGGTDGFLCFGYRVSDEAVAGEAVARAMAKHLPGTTYHFRVREDVGCHGAFDVLSEFLPRRFTLQLESGQPLGTYAEVQSLIKRSFPAADFQRTPSGSERIRSCEEKNLPISPELRKRLEGIVSEWEGIAEEEGFRVRFGLGSQEPVSVLEVTPFGAAPKLERGLAALELEAGARLRLAEES